LEKEMPKTPVKATGKATQDDAKPLLKEHILNIADELFYREGIRATGVDTIIAKSGVAKTTLYRYYPSKDDLVVAYLQRRNQRFWELIEAEIARYSQPREKLLAIFKWLDELLAKPDCLGCPFIVTSSEFGELDYPGHRVAIEHKQAVLKRLVELATNSGVIESEELGINLTLLIDGAFAQRRLFATVAGVSLTKVAGILVDEYLQK
jgi:AcrR family transcriptional regulator